MTPAGVSSGVRSDAAGVDAGRHGETGPAPGQTDDPSSPSRAGRVSWKGVLRLAGVALLLVLVVRSVDWSAMTAAARAANWILVAPAVLLLPLQVLAAAWLWQRLGRALDPALSLREALVAVLGGSAVAIWTPARSGEFAARPLLMPRGSRVSWAGAVGIETLCRLPVPLILALAGAILIGFPGWSVFSLCAGGVALAALLLCLFPSWGRWASRVPRVGNRFDFIAGMDGSLRVLLVAGHGARYLLLGTQFAFIALAMASSGGSLTPLLAVAASLVVLAAKLLLPMLSIAELGIREGASVFVFSALGMPAEAALQASLVLYGINILVPSAVGALLWIRRPIRDVGPGSSRDRLPGGQA